MVRRLLLIALCLISYLPTLDIPLIHDDYPNISQSRTYGSPEGLSQLWSDPTFRLRATSYWAMYALWSRVGLSAKWAHAISLLLHIVATLLLFSLASQWAPMREGAFWAAAFFAVFERHQEAVMWYSAINELLLFIFGIGAMICWLKAAKSSWWHVPGVLLFALALLSKESAIVLLPLFLLVRWRVGFSLIPYVALAAAAVMSVIQSKTNSFRFSDGSFSLHAPFWITIPHSTFRLLWVWGLIALIFWIVRKQPAQPVWLAAIWIVVALVPYGFLTYSTAIPSRQVYLASAGLAMLVGLAFSHLSTMADRRIVALVAAVIVIHNVGTLWTKKRQQFLERAAPTEHLLMTVRSTTGPLDMRCFNLPEIVQVEAVRLAAPEALPRLVQGGTGKSCP